MDLRHRGRTFRLPRCKYNLWEKNFYFTVFVSIRLVLDGYIFSSDIMRVHASPCFSSDACVCRAQINVYLLKMHINDYLIGHGVSLQLSGYVNSLCYKPILLRLFLLFSRTLCYFKSYRMHCIDAAHRNRCHT